MATSKTFASDQCAQYLKAVGAAERLKIIGCLRDGPKNVSEISAALDVEIVKVSHHLQVLRHAGVVSDRKEGRFVIYTLNPEVYSPSTARQSSDHLDFGAPAGWSCRSNQHNHCLYALIVCWAAGAASGQGSASAEA